MDTAFLSYQDRETIRQSVLCSAMDEDDQAEILASGSVLTCQKSDFIFEQGMNSQNLYLILNGWAQITREERDGSQTLIATFHKGDSLAEIAAFLGKPYPASAQAMTDLRALTINGPNLLDIMQGNRKVLAQSLASLYRKLHVLVDDVEWLKSRTIRERLAKFLLEQVQENVPNTLIQLPYSKSLIAAKLGTSPQQLSRTFTELQEFGVQVNGRTAVIANTDTLEAMLTKN